MNKTRHKEDLPGFKTPVVGVGSIIQKNGQFLLVKRGQDPGKGLWSVPGGKLKWGETLEAAAERETFEETGVKVRAKRVAGVDQIISCRSSNDYDYHFVLIDMICDFISGVPVAAEDAQQAAWFNLDEIRTLKTTDGLYHKLIEWTQDQ